MRKAVVSGVLVGLLAVSIPANAAEFFVAPDGSDSNPGTMAQPFGTLPRAQMAAAAGDTVYIRGGVYRFSGTTETIGVAFTKSGEQGKPIRYFAYENEVPIFDFFELKPQARVTGLDVRCNWIHLRGLEVRGVRQLIVGDSWGVRIRGDNNVIERLNVHDNEAPGIFITSGASNLILNCDSHHNYDPLEQGGNADGFGCHSTGGNNVMRGCRAWENSDDGYDFINAPGTCIAEESWAFRNGYIPDTNMAAANGAGFKSGGFGNPPNTPAGGAPRHVIRKSVAFGNRAIGFYANYHPGGIDFLNNTAFDNPANYDMRVGTGATSAHTLRNNIAATPGRTIVSLSGGSDTNNSWSLPVEVSAADFINMDKAIATMPRGADGSLPDSGFLRLAEGSDLIDRGEDVKLEFSGKAPDLGAFEYGESRPEQPDAGMPDAAAGGSGGSGRMSAAGGAGATVGGGAAGSFAGSDGAGSGAGARAMAPVAGSPQPMAAGRGNAGTGAQTAGGMPVQQPMAAASAGAERMTPSAEGEGCSCRVGQNGRSAGGAWGLLLAATFLIVRTGRRQARFAAASAERRSIG